MKRFLAMVVSVAFLLTACTGTFTLTKKVHKFNRDIENKWAEEAVFLAFVIIPVYGLATLGDALIFNSLEFWTGDNPMASTQRQVPAVAYDPLLDRVVVSSAGQGQVLLTLERSDQALLARDAKGQIVYRIVPSEDGSVAVYGLDGKLLQQLDSAQVAALQARFAG